MDTDVVIDIYIDINIELAMHININIDIGMCIDMEMDMDTDVIIFHTLKKRMLAFKFFVEAYWGALGVLGAPWGAEEHP